MTFAAIPSPIRRSRTGELLELIDNNRIDTSLVITHTAPLADDPGRYKAFRDKADGCIKVVLKP